GRPRVRSRGKNLWGHLLFPDILECSLEEDSEGYWRAAVTLDPATAQPQILMSPDGWAAGCQELPPAPLPSGMEHLCCVLGWPGFVGGWHSWAVKVHPAPDWALGVVREFVSRK
ncbi:TRI11 ligase, partial [Zosterops hypoxanthus]|nr:TRI11 ligase [Zosterops hypoxanthus]